MTELSDLWALAIVNALIWAGIFIYLWRLDAKVKRLEREKEL
jgi:CcmD family protein